MSDEQPKKKQAAAGAPAYMTTFADLMALLMCFFVLLLSFSEMDVQKFKQVAGSMANAFGVQTEVFAKNNPMGTSFVARDFTPGRPDPTPIKVMTQIGSPIQAFLDMNQIQQRRAQIMARKMRDSLKDEIKKGQIKIETVGEKIIVRIQEKGSFASGSADLDKNFIPILVTIGDLLAETPGQIVVDGHTDNIPIRSGRFRSNWELSAARAVSVVHELMTKTALPQDRFLIRGHGEVKPLAANDSAENRALNRRVEITLEQDPPTRGRSRAQPSAMPKPAAGAPSSDLKDQDRQPSG